MSFTATSLNYLKPLGAANYFTNTQYYDVWQKLMKQEHKVTYDNGNQLSFYPSSYNEQSMQVLEMLRARANESRRVTLEFPVSDIASDSTGILRPDVMSDWLSDAHMTVLHLGRMPSLVNDLRQAGAKVTIEEFTSQVAEVWAPVLGTTAVRGAFVLEATRVAELRFGSSSTTVLEIEVTLAVQRIRDNARNALLGVFALNGISDPEKFMAESPAIRQPSPRWHPHVSLPMPISTAFPERDIPSGALKLKFDPLKIR
ncbi:hypothetical protein KNN17_21070 [Arthrobacter bambusae]|uniref:hypothetical protein n=1 Tax=Arthrobacter bambusae TaxID=1338426 RepID=UPI001F5095BA|nr:hypothetical protein [Arthrobacter bambusae]MCI0144054.1 hypothetical protein [Arthrobacter bambusae]